jgi:uncharacterized protein (DUF885 family)
MLDKKLDNLARDYFEFMLKSHPTFGTMMGFHEYDEEMPEGTLESIKEYQGKTRNFHDEVKAIDPHQLSFEGRIDREAVLSSTGVQIFEDEAHGRWRSHPEISMEVGSAVHILLVKDFAPLEERLRRIASRLEKIPQFLENRKQVLTDPVDIWVRAGIRECKNVTGLMNIIREIGKNQGINDKLQERLNNAAEKTSDSLADFAGWLQNDILPDARANFPMKPEDFDKLIEMRELGMTTDEMLQFGWKALDEARALQKELVEKNAPGTSVSRYKKMVESIGPSTFEEALEKTREAVEHSRRFVIDSGFATVPEGEELQVLETPEFMRDLIPFGAYNPPGRFDKKQVGMYYLSPPPAGKTSRGDCLENLHIGSIMNTSVHEGYPGHHLQMTCANMNKSYSRSLVMGVEFIEGWAHYCEEMVALMGFSNVPEVMFERYNDMVWRAVRIIVDIKLSRGEMSFDEAVEFLSQETGFGRESCISEVDRYTFTPGYQLSYLIGKKRILEILNSVKKEAGTSFDLRKFHDSMLYAGSLPVSIMEKVVRHSFDLEPEKSKSVTKNVGV